MGQFFPPMTAPGQRAGCNYEGKPSLAWPRQRLSVTAPGTLSLHIPVWPDERVRDRTSRSMTATDDKGSFGLDGDDFPMLSGLDMTT